MVWVLSRGYGYERQTIAHVIRRILSVQEFRVNPAETAWQAVRYYEQGEADFADYLIGLGNQEEKAVGTDTFDRKAAESVLFKMVPI
jgi:predicted nucleic-acid-binding protein